MCVTVFTVGYGDIVPHTLAGRGLTIVFSFLGAFMISMLVVTVQSIF
jgi:hypothetical protein